MEEKEQRFGGGSGMPKLDVKSRATGFLIAVVGVLAVGPDAVLLRAQQDAGGTISVISVWRYALLMLCNSAAGVLTQGR